MNQNFIFLYSKEDQQEDHRKDGPIARFPPHKNDQLKKKQNTVEKAKGLLKREEQETRRRISYKETGSSSRTS